MKKDLLKAYVHENPFRKKNLRLKTKQNEKFVYELIDLKQKYCFFFNLSQKWFNL